MSRIPCHHRSSETRALGGQAGQTLAEYAVLVAGIAVACAVAVLVFAVGVRGLVDSTDTPPAQGPLVPPRQPELRYPTKLEECEDGGWRNYPQFRDEQDCREYVETFGR